MGLGLGLSLWGSTVGHPYTVNVNHSNWEEKDTQSNDVQNE